jgi:hypothetical protein
MADFMKNSWFEEFRQYLDSTDDATLRAEWAKVEAMGFQGPNAFEYVEYLCRYYTAKRVPCHIEELEIPANMTPNFSGSFF